MARLENHIERILGEARECLTAVEITLRLNAVTTAAGGWAAWFAVRSAPGSSRRTIEAGSWMITGNRSGVHQSGSGVPVNPFAKSELLY